MYEKNEDLILAQLDLTKQMFRNCSRVVFEKNKQQIYVTADECYAKNHPCYMKKKDGVFIFSLHPKFKLTWKMIYENVVYVIGSFFFMWLIRELMWIPAG